MSEVRFGIIGYGGIGKRHNQRIDEVEEARLTAICDKNEKAYAEVDQEAIFCTGDADAFFARDDIDVVNVTSPNGLHHEMSLKALKAGKHVVCEKPMALSVLNCNEMIMTAERCNRKLFVVKQNRFNPPIVRLRQILEEGVLGKLYFVVVNCFWNRNPNYYLNSDWKGTSDMDGGTLYTQFSHFVDLIYYLCGDLISVYAQGRNYNHPETQFEDTGMAFFELANEGIGTINFTTCAHQKNFEGSITLFAEKGTIKIGGQYLNVLEYQNIEDYVIEELEAGNKPNDYGYYQGSMSNHDKVIENVVKTLNGTEVVATSAFEGMKTVQIIESMYESMRINKRVFIR